MRKKNCCLWIWNEAYQNYRIASALQMNALSQHTHTRTEKGNYHLWFSIFIVEVVWRKIYVWQRAHYGASPEMLECKPNKVVRWSKLKIPQQRAKSFSAASPANNSSGTTGNCISTIDLNVVRGTKRERERMPGMRKRRKLLAIEQMKKMEMKTGINLHKTKADFACY